MQTINQLKEKFISDTESILKDLNQFKSLTEDQINWKPGLQNWSISECVDHLSVTNKLYLTEFEKQIANQQIKTNCSVTGVKHKLMSRFIIKSVNPNNVKKVKTFKVFMPSQSNYSKDVFSGFIEIQQSLINQIKSTDDLNFNRYVMSSPAAKFIKENFCDVLEIIRLHDRRHFNQAERVLNHSNFPRN